MRYANETLLQGTKSVKVYTKEELGRSEKGRHVRGRRSM
jgi:hypothetical protein